MHMQPTSRKSHQVPPHHSPFACIIHSSIVSPKRPARQAPVHPHWRAAQGGGRGGQNKQFVLLRNSGKGPHFPTEIRAKAHIFRLQSHKLFQLLTNQTRGTVGSSLPFLSSPPPVQSILMLLQYEVARQTPCRKSLIAKVTSQSIRCQCNATIFEFTMYCMNNSKLRSKSDHRM